MRLNSPIVFCKDFSFCKDCKHDESVTFARSLVRFNDQECVTTYKARTGRYDAIARHSSLPKVLPGMEEAFFRLPVKVLAALEIDKPTSRQASSRSISTRVQITLPTPLPILHIRYVDKTRVEPIASKTRTLGPLEHRS